MFLRSKFSPTIAVFLSLASVSTAHAGSGTSGGGDGTVARFMFTAERIGQWLKTNGSSLNPPVDPAKFESAINSNKIISIDHPLYVKNVRRDCSYDRETDVIACDRERIKMIPEDSPEEWRLFTHEVFRKMGLEGDDYRITSQIISINFPNPKAPMDGKAKLHFQDTFFTAEKVLVAGAGNEWQADNGSVQVAVDGSYKHFILQGTLTVREFDPDTYAAKVTDVPAFIRYDLAGLDLRAPFGTGYVIPLQHAAGRSISELFGEYNGSWSGASIMPLGVGYRKLRKSNGMSMDTGFGWYGGYGLFAVHVQAQLEPGYFSRNEQFVEAEVTRTVDQASTQSTEGLMDTIQQRIAPK